MNITCPFCEKENDVLKFDRHLADDCVAYKKAKIKLESYNATIEKLQNVIKQQDESHLNIQSKFDILDKLKKKFITFIKQAVFDQQIQELNVPSDLIDFKKFKKKVKDEIKERTKKIIDSLQIMIRKPKSILNKKTIENIKEDIKKSTKKIWQIIIVGVAGSGLFFSMLLIYFLFLGIQDIRIVSISVLGMSVLIKFVYDHKVKVKEKLSKLKFWGKK